MLTSEGRRQRFLTTALTLVNRWAVVGCSTRPPDDQEIAESSCRKSVGATIHCDADWQPPVPMSGLNLKFLKIGSRLSSQIPECKGNAEG
jgi:hypothetical protein